MNCMLSIHTIFLRKQYFKPLIYYNYEQKGHGATTSHTRYEPQATGHVCAMFTNLSPKVSHIAHTGCGPFVQLAITHTFALTLTLTLTLAPSVINESSC